MIIPSTSFIRLDYNPATDILSVELPDIRHFSVSEVSRSLQLVVEAIANYDIKKLFLDSSKAIIEVHDEGYREVILSFGRELMKTRLQKLARIGSSLSAQEQRANRVAEEARQTMDMPIEFQNFRSKAEAMEWLLK